MRVQEELELGRRLDADVHAYYVQDGRRQYLMTGRFRVEQAGLPPTFQPISFLEFRSNGQMQHISLAHMEAELIQGIEEALCHTIPPLNLI